MFTHGAESRHQLLTVRRSATLKASLPCATNGSCSVKYSSLLNSALHTAAMPEWRGRRVPAKMAAMAAVTAAHVNRPAQRSVLGTQSNGAFPSALWSGSLLYTTTTAAHQCLNQLTAQRTRQGMHSAVSPPPSLLAAPSPTHLHVAFLSKPSAVMPSVLSMRVPYLS